MKKIRIVTDSTADLPTEICQQLGVEVVPLKIQFGTDTYIDRITMDSQQFYEKLTLSSVHPSTSQPSPNDFLEVYERILSEPDVEILSIHISSAMSGTYQSATIAASMLNQQSAIHIFDSLTASYGIGALVVAAAQDIQDGKTIEEIYTHLKQIRSQFHIFFLLDTLEYLKRGGRIGKVSAFVGSLLNVKPILYVDQEGHVVAKDKARGQKKALDRLVELIEEEIPSKRIHLQIAISDNRELAEYLHQLIANRLDVRSMMYISLSPAIGTHTGPGAVAAFVSPA